VGDWGRPARRHPLLGLRGRVRARMIVIAHVSFLPQGNGGVVIRCRPQEEAGTKAVIPVVLMPISMSSKTHMVCFGRLRRFDV